ncbi:MAG: hypothetical protein U0795_11390 [Pirellulales bacterium]
MALILLALSAPWLWSFGRAELGQWRMAEALDRELDGDLTAARAAADRAVQTAPQSPALRYQRAMIAIAQGDPQAALDDCRLALEKSPQNRHLLVAHMMAAQMLGHHDDAIRDATQMVETARAALHGQRPSSTTVVEYALALNSLAYARAQAKRDLDQGLQEINEALQLVNNEPQYRNDPSMLDTRGYLQLLRGELEAADTDLNQAIGAYEALLSATINQVQEDAQGLVDQRAVQREIRHRNESLGVMYQHRGLVHEASGRKNLAQQDFEAARKLGYAPDKGVY